MPESYFPNVKQGMKVQIESDIYPGEKFPATIEVIYPTIDASSHTFQVRCAFPTAASNSARACTSTPAWRWAR